MIQLFINDKNIEYSGASDSDLMSFLRNELKLISVKDGCSGQATCGACTVEIDGKARLSCVTKMSTLAGKHIYTLEGIEQSRKETIAKAFVEKGGVQCGFCTPGIIVRSNLLLKTNPLPKEEAIITSLKPHLCRCTGYIKIIEAVKYASEAIHSQKPVEFTRNIAKIGSNLKKHKALETALAERKFTDDIFLDGMLFGALKFSSHPRARIKSIDVSEAEKTEGVIRIFTASDIPGNKIVGLIKKDWPVMIPCGEITHYIGDVLAGVVAISDQVARKAAILIKIDYEILEPVTDVERALEPNSPQVHEGKPNLIDHCIIKRGNAEQALLASPYLSTGIYTTQRIEHAFLEKECAVAFPFKDGIKIFSQGQGIYSDRQQIATLLNLPEEKIEIELIPNGGAFGGKEDLSVQGHAALFAFLLKKPIKVRLSRPESLRMHPKRHPVSMNLTIGANENGKLTAIKLQALGDTGAYASVSMKVMERVGGHASGGYYIPNADIETKSVYTNNIPSGAMRGFGVPQINFALECAIDDLCDKAGFDRWKFRYDNALIDGLPTVTGQKVKRAGIRECLLALKDDFYRSKYCGLATGIKNTGLGNGVTDESSVTIEIKNTGRVVLKHGWTEMGQGINTIAIQILCEETGINQELIDIEINTEANLNTGMTTASRGTALLGNAIIDAAAALKTDLKQFTLNDLIGKTYHGSFVCNWTTKIGAQVDEPITHLSYGYAAHLCVLNDEGRIETYYAAHDAGKILNPVQFEGQIEGAVMMGIGYALTEDLPMKNGQLISDKFKDCGLLRTTDMVKIVVKGIEVPDETGPYGAKGVGEIGMVPVAAAVVNAISHFDKVKYFSLPVSRK